MSKLLLWLDSEMILNPSELKGVTTRKMFMNTKPGSVVIAIILLLTLMVLLLSFSVHKGNTYVENECVKSDRTTN